MADLKPCTNCEYDAPEDLYVTVRCPRCLMTGPQMNGGRNDDHCDYKDRERAIALWNDLPRRKRRNEI